MQRKDKTKMACQTVICLCIASAVFASKPIFTIAPQTPGGNNITVQRGDIEDVTYVVTNNLHKTKTLSMQPMANITQRTLGQNRCSNPFTLASGASCELKIRINTTNMASGTYTGGPIICIGENNALSCNQPNVGDLLNVTVLSNAEISLSVDTTDLAIAAQGILTEAAGVHPAASSSARAVQITNNGPSTAHAVNFSFTPALPAGTTASPASTCGNISPGDTCTITITPGSTPSGTAGSAPDASIMTIQGTNTNQLKKDIFVLTYGNLYPEGDGSMQGYIFSIDDSTPNTHSVAGKVSTQVDAGYSTLFPWSSNSHENVQGTSFSDSNACGTGATGGECNSRLIIDHYGSSPTTALACKTISSNTENPWYSPAICELGFTANSTCSYSSSIYPEIQNIFSNIVDFVVRHLSGHYIWTSTQSDSSPQSQAYAMSITQSGSVFVAGINSSESKSTQISIICARTF